MNNIFTGIIFIVRIIMNIVSLSFIFLHWDRFNFEESDDSEDNLKFLESLFENTSSQLSGLSHSHSDVQQAISKYIKNAKKNFRDALK